LGVDGERIDGLVQTQQRVLHDAAKWVAPGGQLVYATCSVLRVENEGAVAAFLERHPEFSQRSIRRWDVGETDGFFTADLVRR
jgi:16S rRNA (cytosine967-C5)-methyltransferase